MSVFLRPKQSKAVCVCLHVGRILCVCVKSDTICARVCVDVDYMYYAAELGEPRAINKTGLQCVHWRNNLSDTIEKESKDEVGSTDSEKETGGNVRQMRMEGRKEQQ